MGNRNTKRFTEKQNTLAIGSNRYNKLGIGFGNLYSKKLKLVKHDIDSKIIDVKMGIDFTILPNQKICALTFDH